ncbi:TolC family protein [Alteromonas sp. 1_MG-2023]|uniref:TolC family protein n=1 Tax=Alteromonas sp. 1_MG-2023 TaxID=3062669 RepID=UPI0026E484FD|nr:TolC family protein [Alteromonas sp. 1_MG-2023]MDO6567881.1 TolC family protein [Alteromonas sp. 1_MG-2023]
MRKLAVFSLALVFSFPWVSPAKAASLPSVAELIESMQYHHPYTQAIAEGEIQSGADIDIALSEFDPYIEQQTSSRISGYYDGLALQQRAIKPLESLNASVYTEYRVSDGDFPVYEQEYETLSGGEASVGIALSLLKNREVDKRRIGVRNARLAAQQWEAEAQDLLNSFLHKGLTEYLLWYESALQVVSVESLLSRASERERALSTRVEKGDLARATLTEFKANVLEQRLLVAKLKQKRNGHARTLSYYWRDKQGEMIPVRETKLSPNIQWPFSVNDTQVAQLRQQISQHPQLALLRMNKTVVQNKQALAKNALLPKLDLKASLARDIGSGPNSLDGTESKVGLAFSYPLGNRKAKAEQVKLVSKERELDNKYVSSKQSIEQAFEKAYEYWLQAKEIASLQQQNAELAKQLSNMELQRFDAGDSDMFTLNARASNEIKAQMKAIETNVDLLNAELMLYRVVAMLHTVNN